MSLWGKSESLAADFIASHLALRSFQIGTISGKHNILSDCLSRIYHTSSDITRKDIEYSISKSSGGLPKINNRHLRLFLQYINHREGYLR